MKLPIRNRGSKPMTLMLELIGEEHEVPVGGEAIVHLEDGLPHSIEVHDDCVVVYDEGSTWQVDLVAPDAGTTHAK